MALPKKVTLFDSTLREGLQLKDLVIDYHQIGDLAMKLIEDAKMPLVEVAFPSSVPRDMDALDYLMKKLRGKSKNVVSSLGFIDLYSIDTVFACGAKNIALTMTGHDTLMSGTYKFNRSKETHEGRLRLALKAVEYAKDYKLGVFFYVENAVDAFLEKGSRGFLAKVIEGLDGAGVDYIDLSDTNGVCTPSIMSSLVRYVVDELEVDPEKLFVHCHNDRGTGLANSMAAFEQGVGMISCALRGLGERSGLPHTEHLVKLFEEVYGYDTGINKRGLSTALEWTDTLLRNMLPRYR